MSPLDDETKHYHMVNVSTFKIHFPKVTFPLFKEVRSLSEKMSYGLTDLVKFLYAALPALEAALPNLGTTCPSLLCTEEYIILESIGVTIQSCASNLV